MRLLPKALLDPKVPPLLLGHAVRLGNQLSQSLTIRGDNIRREHHECPNLWQHDMPVLVLVIFVLV